MLKSPVPMICAPGTTSCQLAQVGVSNKAHKPIPQHPRNNFGVLLIAASTPVNPDTQSIVGNRTHVFVYMFCMHMQQSVNHNANVALIDPTETPAC
ncbi:hypothetical protein EMIT0P2_110030 [Pseudomonas sp. IT-P2]